MSPALISSSIAVTVLVLFVGAVVAAVAVADQPTGPAPARPTAVATPPARSLRSDPQGHRHRLQRRLSDDDTTRGVLTSGRRGYVASIRCPTCNPPGAEVLALIQCGSATGSRVTGYRSEFLLSRWSLCLLGEREIPHDESTNSPSRHYGIDKRERGADNEVIRR